MSSRARLIFKIFGVFLMIIGIADVIGILPLPEMVYPDMRVVPRWQTGLMFVFGSVATFAMILITRDKWDMALTRLIKENKRPRKS